MLTENADENTAVDRREEELMNIWKILRKPILTAVAAMLLFAGPWAGLAKADGAFLVPFPPAYPAGIPYDIFVATLVPFLPDSDSGLLGTANERCDDDFEAVTQIALTTALAIQVAADAAHDTNSNPGTVAAKAAAAVVTIAAETVLRQCSYQTALVDSAEIEAGFENTVKLIALGTRLYETQLERNLLNCTAVVGFILPEDDGGLAEWVAIFVQKRIDEYTPVIGDPLRIVAAQARLDQGNIDFAAGLLEDAYDGYCKAYGSLVAGKGRG